MNLTSNSSNATRNPRASHPGTVLVVDDEDAIRELLVMILKLQGYQVLSAESADEALALAETWQGAPIELLITDLAMPGMSGDALADELGERMPAVKVIFTSGYSVDDPMVQRLDLHNAIYLPKPATPRVLQQTIRALFAPAGALC